MKKNKRDSRRFNILILVIAFLILVIGCAIYFFFIKKDAVDVKSSVTLANYDRLTIGMKQEQVFEIINKDDCIIAGTSEDNQKLTTIFSCPNTDGSNIQLIFTESELSDKSHFDLDK